MTALDLGLDYTGPMALTVGSAAAFSFDVVEGLADVPDTHLAAVLAVFPSATRLDPAGSQDSTTNPDPATIKES